MHELPANAAPSVTPLALGVHAVEKSMPGFLVRAFTIAGTRRAVVLDTLTRPADMLPVLPLVEGRDVIVIYSHADWDHIQGTAGLNAPGRVSVACILAHDACAARFHDDAPTSLERLRQESPGQYEDVRLLPPDATFSSTLTLDLGGLTVELAHLPGHTSDSVVAFVPEMGLFFPGDTVEAPLPGLDWEAFELDSWLEGLRRWQGDARVQRVCPSHGALGGVEGLAQTINYLSTLHLGGPFELPEGVSPFYAEVHAANVARAARQRRRLAGRSLSP